MDCEGGNNPVGQIRRIVDVMAMLSSTLIVQVVWGGFSEAQLSQIGVGLAQRDRLLKHDGEPWLPAQRLLLTANCCNLQYTQDNFDAMLRDDDGRRESAQNELRRSITSSFQAVLFHVIAQRWDAAQACAFVESVDGNCGVLELKGARPSGAQVVEFLQSMLDHLVRIGTVPIQSILRHVIYDHLLSPLVLQLVCDFSTTLPVFDDDEYRIMRDMRHTFLDKFELEVENITHVALVREARDDLKNRLAVSWDSAHNQNCAIGKQVRDVTFEEELRLESTVEHMAPRMERSWRPWENRPRRWIRTTNRVHKRKRNLLKNGEVVLDEWYPTNSVTKIDQEQPMRLFRCFESSRRDSSTARRQTHHHHSSLTTTVPSDSAFVMASTMTSPMASNLDSIAGVSAI